MFRAYFLEKKIEFIQVGVFSLVHHTYIYPVKKETVQTEPSYQ